MTSLHTESHQKQSISPFIDTNTPQLIVHCCHHKVATVWFLRILKAIANHYDLQFQRCEQDAFKADSNFFLQDHSEVDVSKLPPHRGSHIIRDLRDVIISGYFFHLWTPEEWVHRPNKKYDGMSYQQYLNSLDLKQGLIAEMERFAGRDFKGIIEWNYNLPEFIEIKYEDLIKDQKGVFTEIFKHYGFNDEAINVSLEIVEKFSFKNVAKRSVGEVGTKTHLRSGKPGEWKDIFDQQHKEKFKELFGDALVQLGYEKDNDW